MDNILIAAICLVVGLVLGTTIGMGIGATHQETIKYTAVSLDCPTCKACPPERICATTCPTCPPQKEQPTCQQCPTTQTTQPEPQLTKKLTNWFKNECRIKDGGSGYQAGSADTCDNGAKYFQIEGYPKFSTKPNNNLDLAAFYTQGDTTDKNPGYFTFLQFEQYGRTCFNISQYPDQNNRKRWTWNNNECQGSTLTVCHL